MFKMKKIILFSFFFSSILLAQSPIRLEPWIEVRGSVACAEIDLTYSMFIFSALSVIIFF